MERLDREQVVELVTSCVGRVAADFQEPWAATSGEQTPILADGGVSSLTVVAIMVEVEQELTERLGVLISLASDSLMSARRSPLATVGSFTDFVLECIAAA